jgi:hypothetical protein
MLGFFGAACAVASKHKPSAKAGYSRLDFMLWRVDSEFAKVAAFTTYKLTEPGQALKAAPWFGIGPLRFRVSDSPHAGLLPILKNQRSSARIGCAPKKWSAPRW